MERLILKGDFAQVELTTDPDEGDVVAECVVCGWTERYDTMGDAVEYAADHADRDTR